MIEVLLGMESKIGKNMIINDVYLVADTSVSLLDIHAYAQWSVTKAVCLTSKLRTLP